jgi:hypothetical protein
MVERGCHEAEVLGQEKALRNCPMLERLSLQYQGTG